MVRCFYDRIPIRGIFGKKGEEGGGRVPDRINSPEIGGHSFRIAENFRKTVIFNIISNHMLVMPDQDPTHDVVIFCGGRGTRLSERTREMPKPLIELGEYPILWHIMKIYNHFNDSRFILTLGYKGEMIVDYFVNQYNLMQNFSVCLSDIQIPPAKDDWEVVFVQTGRETKTARRLLMCRDFITRYPFMATYGDGVANIDIDRLLDQHRQLKEKHDVLATITITRPYSKYGIVRFGGDLIDHFREKPLMNEYINVGFMVLEAGIFDYINDNEDVMFEETLEAIAADGRLGYYIHDGFWHAMDNYKDYVDLNELWRVNPEWKVWND